MKRKTFTLLLCSVMIFFGGCAQAPVSQKLNDRELTDRARGILVTYTHAESALYRAHAIEALADADQTSAAHYVVAGLTDVYWGVRFSACMALMKFKYAPAKALLTNRLNDPNKSVQAAAAGALHLLGEKQYIPKLDLLLFDKDPIVRRNTATVLGRMGDPGAIKLLRATLHEEDLSLKLQVLEAMTLLRYAPATRLMMTYCRSIYDDECILAMQTLGQARCEEAGPDITYVYDKSNTADRLGMRLVAARALAMLGDDQGRNTAVAALQFNPGRLGPAATIRNLAAMALGEIKDKTTLGNLEQALSDNDPDVRIAAAAATLKTLQSDLPY
jgi:HEAT repeat protein